MASIPVAFEVIDANSDTLLDINGDTLVLDVDYTAVETPASWTSLTPYDQLDLFDEAISDLSGQAVPSPLTFKTNSPVTAGVFEAVAVAVDVSGLNRSNTPCATLVAPHYAMVATHVPGGFDEYFFKKANGTEISRTLSAIYDLGFDCSLVRFGTSINDIDPMPILEDSAVLSSRKVIALEADRHLNVMQAQGPANTGGATTPPSNSNHYLTITRLIAEDSIEDGDSAKPMIVLIDGNPVLTGTIFSVTTASPYIQAYGPNLPYFIAAINAIMAADGEELTVLRLLGSGTSGGVVMGAVLGATTLLFDEEED